jgi:two-component system, LytTR family, response regulator
MELLRVNSLRLLIVDDEPLIRKGIRTALLTFHGVEILGECGSGSEAIESITSKKPDLVLLDIQMPDCTGLEVIRRIGSEQMPPVIFITAYDEYAIKAFEVNAVDYILKPFDDSRLRESLERAMGRISASTNALIAQRLESLLQVHSRRWPERLVVRNGERLDLVPVETIDWIESANNYVELHCGTKQYLMAETMTNLEAKLDPDKFIRIHRGRIVNASRIKAIHPLMSSTYAVELRNGIRLTSGRQYKDAVQLLLRN